MVFIVEDIFYQWPDTFGAIEDFVSALKAEYIDWIENKIAEMEDALGELDKLNPDVQCGTFDIYDRVMQLLNTRNLFEVLNGIWLNDDIKL